MGAEQSVIDQSQEKAYGRITGRHVNDLKYPLVFRFGDGEK